MKQRFFGAARLFALWALLAFVPGGVHAGDPAAAPATVAHRWSRFFPGDPVNPAPAFEIEHYIGQAGEDPAERSACFGIQQEVARALNQYGELASDNHRGEAERLFEKTRDRLRALEKSGGPCFELAARTYLAGSLVLLDPSSHQHNVVHWLIFRGQRLPYGVGLALLGAALLDRPGALELLTSSQRLKLAAGDPDSLWLKRQEKGKKKANGDYVVSAGHDCANTRVYVDPYLPPLNAGAVFVHELAHLFSDRLSLDVRSGRDWLTEDFADAEHPDGDLKAYLLSDETLAVVLSAYFQRHLQSLKNFHPLHVFREAHESVPDDLVLDLNLFRKHDGPLARIWDKLETENGTRSRMFADPSPGGFLFETFLDNNPRLRFLDRRLPPGAVDGEIGEIYRAVDAGYFPGEPLTSAQAALLNPRRHGLELSPLARWLDAHAIEYHFDGGPANPFEKIGPDDWVLDGEVKTGEILTPKPMRLGVRLGPLLDGLDEFFAALDDVAMSPVCARYVDAIAAGTLGSYAGAQLSAAGALKSGETGVKGGETGVKGGETGVKGSVFARPCLDLGPNI